MSPTTCIQASKKFLLNVDVFRYIDMTMVLSAASDRSISMSKRGLETKVGSTDGAMTYNYAVGDVVFIRAGSILFNKVSNATGSWTNHVGVIVGHDGHDYVVAESRVPLSSTTRLRRFIARSDNGRYAVRRLVRALSADEQVLIREAAMKRLGILYHPGFKLRSRRQFCSKFVHEVYAEALAEELGTVETFDELLRKNPAASIRFWRFWYFGRIPWKRETITPTSLYLSPRMQTIADNHMPNDSHGIPTYQLDHA
jgi:hypothetical protein